MKRFSKAKVGGGLGVGLVVAVTIIMMILPDDWQMRKPELQGKLWLSGAPGDMLLHYVTEEEREERILTNFRSRGPSDYVHRTYSRYRIHTRRLADDTELKQVRAAEIRNAVNGAGPEILGATTGTLWVWNKQLEARDPATLQVIANGDEVRKRNPKFASILPVDRKFYKVSEPHQTLIFKGSDTKFYRLDAGEWTISPADLTAMKANNYSKSADQGFTWLPIPNEAMLQVSESGFMVDSFGTSTMMWYGLLTQDEREGLTKWPSAGANPSGDVARSLYKTEYKLDDRGKIEIEPEKVVPVGDAQFVSGGFLVRALRGYGEGGRVWDIPSPSSTLVLCKEALGEAQPWHFVRLARDGSIIWKVSSGLVDIHTLSDAGDHIVLLGMPPATKVERFEHTTIATIDTTSPSVSLLKVSEQKLE